MRESLVLCRDVSRCSRRYATGDAVGDVRLARPDELPPGYPYGLRFVVPLVEMPSTCPISTRRSWRRECATSFDAWPHWTMCWTSSQMSS